MNEYGQPQGGGFGPPGGPGGGPPGGYGPPGGGGYGPPGGGGYGPPGGGGYGPPGGGGYGPPGAGGGGPRTDVLAIVALVAGLLAIAGAIGNLVSGAFGMCCPLCTIGGAIIGAVIAVPAITGLVTGILGYRRTAQEPELYSGKGLALAGAITSALALVMTVVTVVGPWLGFGCLAAAAPDRPAHQRPFDPVPMPGVDDVAPSIDPVPIDPPSMDPAQPDPQAGTGGAGACARLAPCCRAYVAEMGGTIPASTCTAYDNVTGMTDDLCGQTMAGYRNGLTAMRRAVPADCNP